MKWAVLLIFISFLNLFFFHRIGPLAWGFLTIGLFIFLKTLIGGLKLSQKDSKFLGLFVLIIIFILLRAFPFVTFLLLTLIFFSFVSYAYQSYFSLPFFHNWIEALVSPFRLAKMYFVTIGKNLFIPEESKAKIRNGLEGKGRIARVMMGGFAIAAPFIFLLILLFTAADPIYGKFVRELFNLKINIDLRLWQRGIISLILFFVFLPFIFFRKKKYTPIRLPDFQNYAFASEMGIAIMLIAIVLGSFLIVQYPYVFVNVPKEINLSAYGVATYSEYVRRGFVELIVAAVIIYSSVLAGLVVWRNSKEKTKEFLKFAQLFLLFELLVFIISIFRRIGLYQSYHGWSLIRIYGGIFLLYLTFMIITMALRHIVVRKWVYVEITSLYLLVFALGIFNAEHFIATSNHPPTVNNRVDYVYLSRLSPDGYEGWKKAYLYAKDILLDKNFKEENIINMEGRRNIAYAGIITDNLLKYYRYLVFAYGNSTEIDDYNFMKNESAVGRKPYDFLDRVYTWNYSEKQAFGRMNKEIGIQQLFLMRQEYLDLHWKIQNQPEDERGFEFDISLNSPLID